MAEPVEAGAAASGNASTEAAALPPLQKLTPRQRELAEGGTTGVASEGGDQAAAGGAKEQLAPLTSKSLQPKQVALGAAAGDESATGEITSNTDNVRRKRPSGLAFDPEAAVNYKSPFLFGTPKAAEGERTTFVSYQKISSLQSIQETNKSLSGGGGGGGASDSGTGGDAGTVSVGECIYEGSKWFWRHDKHIVMQLFDDEKWSYYVARCHSQDQPPVYFPIIYFDKEKVESHLDHTEVVRGNQQHVDPLTKAKRAAARLDAVLSGERRRTTYQSKKQIERMAEKRAADMKKRYREQVAITVLARIELDVEDPSSGKMGGEGENGEARSTMKLRCTAAHDGAHLELDQTEAQKEVIVAADSLPKLEPRISRKLSLGSFKRISQSFKKDLEKTRKELEKAKQRGEAATDHLNVWERALSSSAADAASARRHTFNAHKKLQIVKKLSMEKLEISRAVREAARESAAASESAAAGKAAQGAQTSQQATHVNA